MGVGLKGLLDEKTSDWGGSGARRFERSGERSGGVGCVEGNSTCGSWSQKFGDSGGWDELSSPQPLPSPHPQGFGLVELASLSFPQPLPSPHPQGFGLVELASASPSPL